MIITCPACRKRNESGEAGCSRCGCHLGALRVVCRAASDRLAAAVTALRSGNRDAALRAARESWRLRHTPEAAGIAFVAAAGLAETDAAARWHRRACARVAGPETTVSP